MYPPGSERKYVSLARLGFHCVVIPGSRWCLAAFGLKLDSSFAGCCAAPLMLFQCVCGEFTRQFAKVGLRLVFNRGDIAL
jgi:hypothetical protein